MNRRFYVSLLKCSLIFVVAVCLACSAQSNQNSADLNQRIERQMRAKLMMPPQVHIAVGQRTKSDFPGYDALTVTLSVGDHKQVVDCLISKDNRELLRIQKMDLSKDPYADVMSKIDTTGRPFRGGKDAKVVIVNYDDFECPYCARMHQALTHEIASVYGDRIKIVYKDFPLYEIHPWANRAAVDSGCLADQSSDAYWAFADYVHNNGGEIGRRGTPLQDELANVDKAASEQGKRFSLDAAKLDACLKAQKDNRVRASVTEATMLGVEATPTIFINGEKIDGALPTDDLKAIIDQALKEAGTQAPATASLPPAAGR
jgi:protein-disulfide isomerase